MEDNRLDLSCEMEEMRQQFAIMKERFDRQEIVTDRLLRETQKRRINLYDWLTLYGPVIISVIMLPLMWMCCKNYGMPVWIAVTAYVMIAASALWQYRERVKYRKSFRFEGDVLQIAAHVRNYRIRAYKMTIIAAVAAVIIVAIGLYSWLSDVQLTDDPFRWILFILLFLGVIAAVVALEIKSLRILDSIVKDLEQ